MSSKKPVAVLISDIHFTVQTLELASQALSMAFGKSIELKVPIIIAGDTLDTKAIMRAECVNRLIDLLEEYNDHSNGEVKILVGNHDKINEKGVDHSLNFLTPYADVIQTPVYDESVGSWLVPYQHDPGALQTFLNVIVRDGSRLIMHTGVQTAFMGHYTQDRASLPKEAFANFRVISGHYHRAQDIKCGRPRKGAIGLFSYIGNPYTLSFGEANDGPKGFQILHEDGLLTQVPTNLRKHVVLDTNVENLDQLDTFEVNSGDLVWLKIRGPESSLKALDKGVIGKALFGHTNFRLDLCPDTAEDKVEAVNKTEGEVLDELIDKLPETLEQKTGLKALWRKVME